ncbi:MAG TPA: outer membrane protein assembly factor BamD [Polyangiaceae bacterium]|nr:outer membrane protein assembly factor BamD [Polyangiaceae bacterium]
MRDSIEDLSALSRRGELDAAEQRRLQLALQSSSEARLLHRAGLDLDLAGAMLPGDDALAERVKRRVLARVLPAAPRRRRLLPWGVAAAVACLAVAAGAGAVTELRPLRALFGLSAPEPPAPAQHVALPLAGAVPTPAPVMQAPESAASAAAPALPAAQPSVKTTTAVDAGSASELFASAASARRRGKPQEAIVLYDALQSRFPASAEAKAADIALGMLRLSRGSARSALEHFSRYLARSPRAELAPEALWGQGQALSSLGRQSEARRSFASLLERYPDSTYASAARAKLEATKSAP